MTWAEVDDNDFFPLRRIYNWLLLDFFIYLALALYLDNVLPGTPMR